MNRRERVMAVVEGREPDRIPVGFSLHFPTDKVAMPGAVQAHLDFFRESRTDLCKVMNENLLRGTWKVETPGDLAREVLSAESRRGMEDQVRLVSRLAESLKGEAVLLVTIHGPLVSIQHMSGRPGLFVENMDFYRRCKDEDPAAMRAALEQATEHLCDLAARCMDAGADGIYLAALGAHHSLFSDDEYAQMVQPFDLQVLRAAKASAFHVLHACHMDLAIHRFRQYPVGVVNWEFGDKNPTMQQAFQLFDSGYTIMGGLDNKKGPLIDGTEEAIEAQVHQLLDEAEGRRFLLGAGCTLPTTVDTARLRAAVSACESYADRKMQRTGM